MKPYLLSLGAGLLVGVIYSLLHVRSPAPPAIALLGLLGMLLGEQAVPIAKRLMAKAPVVAYLKDAPNAPARSWVPKPSPERVPSRQSPKDQA
jgi:XapX domain-containing protein